MSTSTDTVSTRAYLADPRVLTLSSTSFLGTLGSGLVAPALPAMATTLGVSDASIGLVMTAYSLPGILSVPILTIVADMYGRRTLFLSILAVYSVAGAAIALTGSFVGVLALRFLQGFAGGVIITLTITILGDLYSGPAGTTAQGIRLSANGVSRIVVPPLAGFLAGIAWQTPFLLYALGLLVTAAAYVTLPETVEGARSDVAILAELRGYARAIVSEVTDRNLGLITAGGFFQGFGWYAILTFVPVFAVRALGASPFEAGLILSIVGVTRITVAPFTGKILAVTSRRGALLAGLGLSAAGAALVPVASTLAWLGVLVGLFGVGDSLFTPVHRDTLTDLTRDTTRAGTVGAASILRKVGTSASPVVFGAILGISGFDLLFVGAGVVFLAYAVGIGVGFSNAGV